MRGKARFDQCEDLAGHVVGREGSTWRYGTRPGGAKRLAVVCVEVPLPAFGFVARHQHAMTLTHLAIEVLHAQRLAAARVSGEIAHAAVEVAIFTHVQRQSLRLCRGFDCLQHAPVAGRCQHQPGRAQAFDVVLQLQLQAAAIVCSVQRRVMQRTPSGAQRLREVAHGGKEHHRARLARPDVRGFLGHLGHPDGIARGVEPVERRGVQVELVAQHDDQVAQLTHVQPWCAGRRLSSTSLRPMSWPSGDAKSSAGRRPRTACWAATPCCRGSWRRRAW